MAPTTPSLFRVSISVYRTCDSVQTHFAQLSSDTITKKIDGAMHYSCRKGSALWQLFPTKAMSAPGTRGEHVGLCQVWMKSAFFLEGHILLGVLLGVNLS